VTQRGRPPAPIELKRRRGRTADTDSGGRPLPKSGELVVLPMADGVPPLPHGIESDGAELWKRIWQEGLTWISPNSDMAAAVEACMVADDLAVARRRYRATSDPKDAKALAAMGKRFDDALSVLGFNPTARSRLGVAEVKRASALEQLLARRNQTS
jgi:phage terminase small subunit